MYRIWCERTLPSKYAPLLEGVAVVAGAGSETPKEPLVALPGCHAILASAYISYDGNLMDQVPSLRVISRTGIGIDNISVPDATARGVVVCNAPDAPTISTSEHAVALLLAAAKKLKRADRDLKQQETTDFFSTYTGVELYGLRLGLVGLGRIGSRVARIAQALEMQVVGIDPLVSQERASEMGVELAPSLDVLLESADIVSLHIPLSSETRHLMNAERLARMKPGSILINAARGGLVDEGALLDALRSGHLQAAGLDVFDPEPPDPSNPLLRRDEVIATPHIAGATGASKDRLWETAIGQALQVLRGERPAGLLNPEIWPPSSEGGRS